MADDPKEPETQDPDEPAPEGKQYRGWCETEQTFTSLWHSRRHDAELTLVKHIDNGHRAWIKTRG